MNIQIFDHSEADKHIHKDICLTAELIIELSSNRLNYDVIKNRFGRLENDIPIELLYQTIINPKHEVY